MVFPLRFEGILHQRTDVRFASFLSGGFTNMAVINPPERKLSKSTSLQWCDGKKVDVLGFRVKLFFIVMIIVYLSSRICMIEHHFD